jgi:tetratricopeptide (TPR) repeat protein
MNKPMSKKTEMANKNLKKPNLKTESPKVNSKTPFHERKTIYIAILLLITAISYLPSLKSDFIPTWDDNVYVIDNPLIKVLSIENFKNIFTTPVGGSYVPLPILTFAIEYHFGGLNPLPYHINNLFLHLIGVLLVFQILCLLNLKKTFAAAAALLYGIHPMGVESVAWVTERKDLLYSGFYFGSLWLYLIYIKSGQKRKFLLLSSLLLFTLSLFSKIQAVSLPLILIVIDYYFDRPLKANLVLEKIPYFLLSLLFGITGLVVLKDVGALNVNEMFSLTERLFFGAYALSAYLLKFFVPITLSAMHPYPISTGNTLPILYYLSPIFILLVGLAVYRTSLKTRAVVFGTLFFFFSIVFMLQVFGAGQGFLADRFTKVPYFGLVFIAGWGLQNLQIKFKAKMPFIWIAFLVYALVLSVSTYNRCKVWKNGETLWTDVIDKYPNKDARPYGCRGLYYQTKNENDKALADMNISLELDKSDPELTVMRGNIFFEKGMDEQAFQDYIHVVKQKKEDPLALGNLGAIYVRKSQFDSAVFYLSKSLELDSSLAIAYANRAMAYSGMGEKLKAIEDFKQYLIYEPNDERVYSSIAISYQSLGRNMEAIEWMGKAIALKPDFGNYYYIRSQIYKIVGNRSLALADALKANSLGTEISPGYISSLN